MKFNLKETRKQPKHGLHCHGITNRRGSLMASTTTVRISKDVSNEVARIAALVGVSSGDLLAKAWKEFLANNKDAFAKDMEEAAHIIRTGTTQDLASFISRDVAARAEAAAEQAQQPQG